MSIMTAKHNNDARPAVAKGIGSVFLARTGSIIELITQPAYTWMFGLASYGLYAVLWSLVNVIEKITDLAMTNALQRVLPYESDINVRAGIIKGALVLGVIPPIIVAAILSLAAPVIAPLFNVADKDQAHLVLAISIFVWSIPLWAMVEIITSMLRACKAFGPEIRLRIFWEQVMRLVLAVIFWWMGLDIMALLLAHLISLLLTVVLSFRVLNRYVSLGLVWRTRLSRPVLHNLLLSGISVLPSNILGRIFSDVPVLFLNVFLPGVAGANAAGLYSIARKLASIPQMVGTVFSHVISPVAASGENRKLATLQTLYTFSLRISLLLALPTVMLLILSVDTLLGLFVTGAVSAWPMVVILTCARGFEAMLGPATAIQQVFSNRLIPMLNTVIGLVVASIVILMAFPEYGATGLALGVASGQVIMAMLSVWQLSRMDNLYYFDAKFIQIVGAALTSCLVMFVTARLTASAPALLQGIILMTVYLMVLWSGLRFALPAQDRQALGKLGRGLRLGS